MSRRGRVITRLVERELQLAEFGQVLRDLVADRVTVGQAFARLLPLTRGDARRAREVLEAGRRMREAVHVKREGQP